MKPLDKRLFSAIVRGDLALAREAIEAGAEVEARDKDGHTPLHAACVNGHHDIVRLLLFHGADVNAKTRHDFTPLHEACVFGHPPVVRLLLDAGADVDVKDMFDDIPLLAARDLPPGDTREEIIDLFREYAPELVMEAYCKQDAADQS